ncbi:hypothetical protein BDZ89DRAFT_923691, partial [Hymenopellis radicata]
KIGNRCARKKTLQSLLGDLCEEEGLKVRKMIKRVATRWNTMHGVVKRALKLRPALDRLVMLPECNQGEAKTHLKRLRLTDAEWSLFSNLLPVLRLLERVTVKMSASSYPTLHEVIPYMDTLNRKLEKIHDDITQPAIITHGVARALAVLDKYYSKTDDSIMW